MALGFCGHKKLLERHLGADLDVSSAEDPGLYLRFFYLGSGCRLVGKPVLSANPEHITPVGGGRCSNGKSVGNSKILGEIYVEYIGYTLRRE